MSEQEITEIAEGLEFPEGPVWMPDGTIVCVELKGRAITRVYPDGTLERIAVPGGSPNGLAIGPDGAGYVANSGGWAFHEVMGLTISAMLEPPDYSGGRIERVDLATGDVDVLFTECDGNPLVGPNDLVFDAVGGMWFTDHGKQRERVRTHGGVYYATADGSSIREVIYPLDSPNGVGLSPDGTRLYVSETHTGRVWTWDVTGPGEVGERNPMTGHGGECLVGLPGWQLFDSLAVDSAGNVVVATIVNGGLTVISPDGSHVDHVAMPDLLVTNVCFGGDDLRTAFVTLSGTGKLVSTPWRCPGLKLSYY